VLGFGMPGQTHSSSLFPTDLAGIVDDRQGSSL
jgi:hypothetical protein